MVDQLIPHYFVLLPAGRFSRIKRDWRVIDYLLLIALSPISVGCHLQPSNHYYKIEKQKFIPASLSDVICQPRESVYLLIQFFE